MAKVKKTSDYEMLVQFEEIFEDNSVESATMKAETQKVPSEFAQVKITESKFNKANIKIIGEENNDSKK
jgi:hypothetical protein|tara:strand:- start:604 stop:810 length:207 start_codon:yes stop_codon:yes gene_type:complete